MQKCNKEMECFCIMEKRIGDQLKTNDIKVNIDNNININLNDDTELQISICQQQVQQYKSTMHSERCYLK